MFNIVYDDYKGASFIQFCTTHLAGFVIVRVVLIAGRFHGGQLQG